MNGNKQNQRGGDYSTNVQVEKQVINTGLSLQDVKSLLEDKIPYVVGEAEKAAEKRAEKLFQIMAPRFENVDFLKQFELPENQATLKLVGQQVVGTDKESDYKLLSELLEHRVKNNGDKLKTTNIEYAIKTIKDLSDEGLIVLTLVSCIFGLSANSADIDSALSIMDNLFTKVCDQELPETNSWLDHLDLLKTIRVNSVTSASKFEEIFHNQYSEILRYGILIGSETHTEALKILDRNELSHYFLVVNKNHPGYLHLRLSNSKIKEDNALTETEKKALLRISDLYSSETDSVEFLNKKMEDYPKLEEIRNWWDKNLSPGFHLTQLGMLIGDINVHLVEPGLPKLADY
ncbi:hypothetical protein G6R29_05105 [Fructobacillus sp. M2-14]|uniref:Uncharacterized protein n=1 Tax=Fructobacillus broussonetiae TaxID=2713173 RepID=A0ABS5R4C1_9LACO|nr:LPO_1073/Vpar_1526 family protein [Fructobacillus broussonetiae]MBS9338997.1 hypothetical protein [Fructobacillus broussonetiae]